MAILVFLSTVFVRQHYVVDIFAAVLLVEIINLIIEKTKCYNVFFCARRSHLVLQKYNATLLRVKYVYNNIFHIFIYVIYKSKQNCKFQLFLL